MLRPMRTVRVTSYQDLPAALATADQIVVEGDDELLSWVVNHVDRRPVEELHLSWSLNVTDSLDHIPRKTVRTVMAATALVALLVIIVGAAVWVFAGKHEGGGTPQSPPSFHPGIGRSRSLLPYPAVPAEPTSNVSTVLQTLAWPLVTIVAIVVLFLIARQAVSSGRNVAITWKVTERVSGRLVITKARQRAPRKQAA